MLETLEDRTVPSLSPLMVVPATPTAAHLVNLGKSADYGQLINLGVTINPLKPGPGTPSGMVVLMDGTSQIAMTTLNSEGKATITINLPTSCSGV